MKDRSYFDWTTRGGLKRETKILGYMPSGFDVVDLFKSQNELRHALSILCRSTYRASENRVVCHNEFRVVQSRADWLLVVDQAPGAAWRGRFLAGILAGNTKWDNVRRKRERKNRRKTSS